MPITCSPNAGDIWWLEAVENVVGDSADEAIMSRVDDGAEDDDDQKDIDGSNEDCWVDEGSDANTSTE